jgi:hypothetical protein
MVLHSHKRKIHKSTTRSVYIFYTLFKGGKKSLEKKVLYLIFRLSLCYAVRKKKYFLQKKKKKKHVATAARWKQQQQQ